MNSIIPAEILTFTRDREQYDAIAADFTAFHWTAVDRVVSLRASDLATGCGEAVTVPGTDLLVFASALEAGAEPMHHDAHFMRIAAENPTPASLSAAAFVARLRRTGRTAREGR